MRVLALDSTTRAGSAALLVERVDGHVVDERSGDGARTHAERLPADLLTLVESHGLAVQDIDLFVVASGPGLFTGLRVGIATMQGLALVRGRPLLGISALDALGHLASRNQPARTVVGAWMNAHRRDVFSALFAVTEHPVFDPARLTVVDAPTVGAPEATLRRWSERGGSAPAVIAGDGAVLYRATIERQLPAAAVLDPGPLAGAIARLGLERHRRGERGSAAAVQPLYIRRPDAEVARDHALAHRASHVDRRD